MVGSGGFLLHQQINPFMNLYLSPKACWEVRLGGGGHWLVSEGLVLFSPSFLLFSLFSGFCMGNNLIPYACVSWQSLLLRTWEQWNPWTVGWDLWNQKPKSVFPPFKWFYSDIWLHGPWKLNIFATGVVPTSLLSWGCSFKSFSNL